jgi:RNA polymerase subunit RPABC4/transcription elongation factor Spt4
MSFFDNLGKKIGETAQAAQKKTNEMVEISKLNKAISTEEDKIQKMYNELGKRIYQTFSSGEEVNPEIAEGCEQIKIYEENIKDLKKKIQEIKNVRTCSNCGAELEANIVFCPKCGTKQEVIQPPAEENKTPDFKACISCGAKLPLDTMFCPNCGAKQEEPPTAPEVEDKAPEFKFCPSCGTKIPADTAFCPNCGVKAN